MIAYCGLDCFECPAYIATQANDDNLRAECARRWNAEFKFEVRPGQVNCDGCKADGRKFFVCKICQVKKCAVERKLDNCAQCADSVCENLEALMASAPNVKRSMEELMRTQGKNKKI